MLLTRFPATLFFLLASLLFGCQTKVTTPAPEPFGALPSERQLDWHKLKYYAFIHFSPNTFTNKEWGYGDESVDIFNPTNPDVEQWARIVKQAGMEGIVITAKHHDGFCLWPSAYTEHSIKNAPYKNGKGDIIQELREACDKYGLKLGIYLSPWDRNHADYGTPAYLDYFRNQLTELLTNYGDIYEVWFDGANGGDGYYGGANEIRNIDNTTYYDWENTRALVRKLQPNAVMFSDAGPDIRWIGNERGYAYDPTWATVHGEDFYPGMIGNDDKLQYGEVGGSMWIGPEVNTSIRPGWFYHPEEDGLVKSINQLVDNWFHSVGMNGNFILNVPPDKRGRIHEQDSAALMGLKAYVDRAFGNNLAAKAGFSASEKRGDGTQYDAAKAFDDDPSTYWATNDEVKTASLTVDFGKETKVNALLLQEYIALGQRIKGFTIEADSSGIFTKVANGQTIGNRRLIKFTTIETSKLRITFEGLAAPVISNVEVYEIPKLIGIPTIQRDKDGMVTIGSDSADPVYRYTLDGSTPTETSAVYSGHFAFAKTGLVQVIAILPESGEKSDVVVKQFDVPKTKWTATATRDNERWYPVEQAVDDNPKSLWKALPQKKGEAPTQMMVDFGEVLHIEGVTYLPAAIDLAHANVLRYRLEIAEKEGQWMTVSEGSFDNMANNPVEQYMPLPSSQNVRYLRFTGLQSVGSTGGMQVAELGVKVVSTSGKN